MFKQPSRYVLPLVHKSMQDHEIHNMAQIQMALHWTHYSHTGDPVYWNPLVFLPCKSFPDIINK